MTYSPDVVSRCATYLASLPDVCPDVVSQAASVCPDDVVRTFMNVAQDVDNKYHCNTGYTMFYLQQSIRIASN